MLNLPTAVVIGMHRSGTSAVCRCLSELGWRGPSNEEGIHAADNPEHFESRRLVDHNEALLEAGGGQWKYPPRGLPQPSEPWISEARRTMADVFPGHGRLIKDPRLSITLDAWDLAPNDTRIIFVTRHPADVADSLARRDGFTTVHGLALWEVYNARAEQLLQGRHVHVIGFEALRNDPMASLESVARFMGLPDDPDTDARVRAAASGIDHSIGGRRSSDTAAAPVIDRWHRLTGLAGTHTPLVSASEPHGRWAHEVLELVRERDALAAENRSLRRKPLKIAVARTTSIARRGRRADKVTT